MVLSGIPYSNSSKQRNLSNSENCILQICSGTKISHNWAWWFLVTKEKACRRRFSNNWGCSSRFLHPHNSLLEFVFVWQEATFWLRPYRTLVSSRESPDHVCRYLRPNGWCLWVIKTRKTKKKLGRRTQTFFWCCFFPSVVFGGWMEQASLLKMRLRWPNTSRLICWSQQVAVILAFVANLAFAK